MKSESDLDMLLLLLFSERVWGNCGLGRIRNGYYGIICGLIVDGGLNSLA